MEVENELIALVTGASKGIGRGIALEVTKFGALTYITGSSERIFDTAREIETNGGKVIPIQCDHSKDDEVKSLFERIEKEQSGKLDLLVNNAFSGANIIMDKFNEKFYEMELDPGKVWDDINNVGLRNNYVCGTYAARLMVKRRSGLIVNISSFGGLSYVFNVAYGVGKSGVDRMTADFGYELKNDNVACVSLWPGAVQTENVEEMMKKDLPDDFKEMFKNCESVTFSGKCIVSMLQDEKIMSKNGRIFHTGDLCDEYNIVDENGEKAPNLRCIKSAPIPWLKMFKVFIPSFLKAPKWLLHLYSYKF
ncbi:hypothetical protein SNEBB_000590 [Seison nebaliae]|nr:hypothetical protein SNEBB_000590 [Seison nebaliae]